jgi:hypothetical protein
LQISGLRQHLVNPTTAHDISAQEESQQLSIRRKRIEFLVDASARLH